MVEMGVGLLVTALLGTIDGRQEGRAVGVAEGVDDDKIDGLAVG